MKTQAEFKAFMMTVPVADGWTKFAHIPNGAHFEDSSGRRFIKLVNVTGCGIPQTFERIVREHPDNPKPNGLPFNAVDYEGFVGTCPDWVPFKIIENPPRSDRDEPAKVTMRRKKGGKVQVLKGKKVIGEQG